MLHLLNAESNWIVHENARVAPTVFLKAAFKLHLPGWAYVIPPLKLLELSFLGLVLLGKAGNDLANLMGEQFMTNRRLGSQRLTPSRFVCNAGTTSLTVLSTRTPPIRRKHFLSGSSASASFSVDRTNLDWTFALEDI